MNIISSINITLCPKSPGAWVLSSFGIKEAEYVSLQGRILSMECINEYRVVFENSAGILIFITGLH